MPMNSKRNRVPPASNRVLGLLVLVLFGCASPPAPTPLPERPAAPASIPTFDAGVRFAVDDLFIQMQRLPAFAPRQEGTSGAAAKDASRVRGSIVLDPPIDGVTGQQTAASRQLEKDLLQRATESFKQFDVLVNDSNSQRRAEYLLAGTITRGDAETYRISLSMSDIKRGLVVAQSAVRVQAAGVDSTPTSFYRDSPSLTKDRVVEGQIQTAQTPAGNPADALYLERLPMNALINDAVSKYEAGEYAEALRYYEEAARRPEGSQLRVFNGLYLVNSHLGRREATEQNFARIVELGIATNSLSIKFLFRPGSTEFWPDPKVSGQYGMWLRAVAREVVASKSCLSLVGHTSRTGSESFNDRLSLQRALAIQRQIEAHAPEVSGRLAPAGVGFRENLIGTGTDDARDALDRRVQFKVRPC